MEKFIFTITLYLTKYFHTRAIKQIFCHILPIVLIHAAASGWKPTGHACGGHAICFEAMLQNVPSKREDCLRGQVAMGVQITTSL